MNTQAFFKSYSTPLQQGLPVWFGLCLQGTAGGYAQVMLSIGPSNGYPATWNTPQIVAIPPASAGYQCHNLRLNYIPSGTEGANPAGYIQPLASALAGGSINLAGDHLYQSIFPASGRYFVGSTYATVRSCFGAARTCFSSGAVAPAGTCSTGWRYVNSSTGIWYWCMGSAWVQDSGHPFVWTGTMNHTLSTGGKQTAQIQVPPGVTTLTSFRVYIGTVGSGCTTWPVSALHDQTTNTDLATYTFSTVSGDNNVPFPGNATSVPVTPGDIVYVNNNVLQSGCSVVPGSITWTAQFQ